MNDEIQTLAQVNAALCTIAFGGLTWRLIGQWPCMTRLSRVTAALLTSLELVVAMAAARRAALGGDFNETHVILLVHTIVVLGVVAAWRWLARSPDSC